MAGLGEALWINTSFWKALFWEVYTSLDSDMMEMTRSDIFENLQFVNIENKLWELDNLETGNQKLGKLKNLDIWKMQFIDSLINRL